MPKGTPRKGINKGWFKAGVKHSEEWKKEMSKKAKEKGKIIQQIWVGNNIYRRNKTKRKNNTKFS
ncbi:MAG TPA: hypothetical protein VFF49_04530 [Thermodesulfobacteriota bacterium]|nr:hypothetical protein [Thermodesulfobacteriota bacterium]